MPSSVTDLLRPTDVGRRTLMTTRERMTVTLSGGVSVGQFEAGKQSVWRSTFENSSERAICDKLHGSGYRRPAASLGSAPADGIRTPAPVAAKQRRLRARQASARRDDVAVSGARGPPSCAYSDASEVNRLRLRAAWGASAVLRQRDRLLHSRSTATSRSTSSLYLRRQRRIQTT